jgi:NTE family protein
MGKESGIAGTLYTALAVREYESAAECVTADVSVSNMATGDIYNGRQGFLEFARGWAVAFPDIRYGQLEICRAEDRFIAEYELEGTHTGPLVTPRGHIPPTGMKIQAGFCDILEIVDDRIARIRSYFDSVSILRQLGLIAGTPLHAADRRAALDLYAQPLDANAPQRHKAIVQRFLQDVYNRRRPAAAADTCSQSLVWHGGTLGHADGLVDYQNVLTSFFTAFPDLELQILDIVAEGDRVVVRFTLCGTHLGQFQGIRPTFKRIAGGGTNTYRIEGDRIAEEWWQGDLLMLVQQMDATPSTLPSS